MTRKSTPLRAIAPDEKPAKPLSLAQAIESGSYIDILIAQRREIVDSLPEEKGPAKAALHRQLSLISKEIEALSSIPADEGGGVADVEDEEFDAASI